MTDKQQRVKAAAEMLDREMPGWHRLVDVDKLVMSSCTACVLGQAFNPQIEGKVRAILGERAPDFSKPSTWGDRLDKGFHYGISFLMDNGLWKGTPSGAFGMVGDCEWKEEILDRQLRDEANTTDNNSTTETANGTESASK